LGSKRSKLAPRNAHRKEDLVATDKEIQELQRQIREQVSFLERIVPQIARLARELGPMTTVGSVQVLKVENFGGFDFILEEDQATGGLSKLEVRVSESNPFGLRAGWCLKLRSMEKRFPTDNIAKKTDVDSVKEIAWQTALIDVLNRKTDIKTQMEAAKKKAKAAQDAEATRIRHLQRLQSEARRIGLSV